MVLTQHEQEGRDDIQRRKPLVYNKILKYDNMIKEGKSIAMILLQYSWACNFKCKHCAPEAFRKYSKNRIFTIPDVKHLADQADEYGLAHIYLSGGEPLIFPELDTIIDVINPDRFFMEVYTNAWLLDKAKIQHLKDKGIDKLQISFDSMDETAHDNWRNKVGSWKRAKQAIYDTVEIGIRAQIGSVITREMLYSQEFEDLAKFTHEIGVDLHFIPPAPLGSWENNMDVILNSEDMAYVETLKKTKYPRINYHLQPAYGLELGCLAVKRCVSITPDGEVLPCFWMYFSLGNIFDTPLKNILAKGMKYFGSYSKECRLMKYPYLITNTYGKEVPMPIEEIVHADSL